MTVVVAHELSLFLVCMWGAGCVLMSGQFNQVVIATCILLLLVVYRLRKRSYHPPRLVANIAAVTAFAAAGFVAFVLNTLLDATIYLFLFLQVIKYFTSATTRELRWCYLISLFHVIGASVLTTGMAFGVMFVIYVLLTLVSLRLFVLRVEAERCANTGTIPADMPGKKFFPFSRWDLSTRLPGGLLLSSLVLTVAVTILSGATFGVIPRLATQNLFQSYGQRPDSDPVSAFSENVEFGAFEKIQLDNAVAMYVQPKDKQRPSYVRMRGVALDSFDGRTWRRTGGQRVASGTHMFRPFSTQPRGELYNYHIIQPPGITNFLFGDTFPTELTVPMGFQYRFDPLAGAVWLTEMMPKEFQYPVTSRAEKLHQRQDPETIAGLSTSTMLMLRDGSGDVPVEVAAIPDGARAFVSSVLRHARHELFTENSGEPMEEDEPMDISSTEMDDASTIPQEPPDPASLGVPHTTNDEPMQDMVSPSESDSVATASERIHWQTMRLDLHRRRSSQSGAAPSDDNNDYITPRTFFGPRPERMNRTEIGRRLVIGYINRCLQLPETLDAERIGKLAAAWTEDAPTTFAKAMAVERRFQNEFGYSLEQRARGNFIEDFLFRTREGHCEYFATSMAVMMRVLGIPARVVNGYYSAEWNQMGGSFIVRQRDAHSWVEVYMGHSYGWMTFDPTPPAGIGRPGTRNALVIALGRFVDAMRVNWYRYVIDYNVSDQREMLKFLFRVRHNINQALSRVNLSLISGQSKTGKAVPADLGSENVNGPAIAGGALAVILLAYLVWRLGPGAALRSRRKSIAVRYYADILQMLEKFGYKLAPGQTPREFARHVQQAEPDWNALEAVTENYYNTRYNGTDISAADLAAAARLRSAMLKKAGRNK